MAHVAAVVVTRDRRELLRVCLDGLLAQTRPVDAVAVVDNASRDGTDRLLRAGYPQVTALPQRDNAGAAGGFARGIAWAAARGAEWIWLMDDDVVPDRDCLAHLLDAAARTGRPVAVPRRVDPDGRDRGDEAVLAEERQELVRVRADPEREPHRLVDLFTFEGPLVHRSVVAAVGLPDASLFIRGEDLLYGVAISRRLGPLAAVLAARAVMCRQLRPSPATRHTLAPKRWLAASPTYEVLADADHWKWLYELRNRHLLWRELGWARRRRRLAALHLGYIAVDLVHAIARGWDWRARLRWNTVSWLEGVRGRRGVFRAPDRYRARAAARPVAAARGRSPAARGADAGP
jgi:glycosyltransferase involved in cell wall biosynthesis